MQEGGVGQARRLIMDDELLRHLLQGLTIREAAVIMDVHPVTLRTHTRKPEFLVKLKELSKEVYARVDSELADKKSMIMMRLEEASEIALDEMVRLVKEAKDPKHRFLAAQDLLDRDGRTSRQRKAEVQVHQQHEFMDPLTLVHIAKTAQEMDQHEQKQLPGENGTLPTSDAVS